MCPSLFLVLVKSSSWSRSTKGRPVSWSHRTEHHVTTIHQTNATDQQTPTKNIEKTPTLSNMRSATTCSLDFGSLSTFYTVLLCHVPIAAYLHVQSTFTLSIRILYGHMGSDKNGSYATMLATTKAPCNRRRPPSAASQEGVPSH